MKLDLLYEVDAPKRWGAPHPQGQREREQRAYYDAIEQIKLADSFGFNTVWAVEHHFREGRSSTLLDGRDIGGLCGSGWGKRLTCPIRGVSPIPARKRAERLKPSSASWDFSGLEDAAANAHLQPIGGFECCPAFKAIGTETIRARVSRVIDTRGSSRILAGYIASRRMEDRGLAPIDRANHRDEMYLALCAGQCR